MDTLAIPWQDVRFLSCHGRDIDLKDETDKHDKLLILLGREGDAGNICDELCKLGYESAEVYIGENLGYDNESVRRGTAAKMKGITTDPLALMFIRKG